MDVTDWRTVLSESEEQLAELRDSLDDPVAKRRYADALFARGRALCGLNRWTEALASWDAMVLLLDSTEQTRLTRRRIMIALVLKRAGIGSEDRAAAAAVNAEIIRRFAGSDDPALHERTTTTFVLAGLLHLVADELDAAIELSLTLAARLDGATTETLLAEAEQVNLYARALSGCFKPGWRGMAAAAAFCAVNASTQHGTELLRRMRGARRGGLIDLLHARAVTHRRGLAPAHWAQDRRRLDAAIALSQRVIDRLGTEPDAPERRRVATVARLHMAMARIIGGQVKPGLREIDAILESPDSSGAQALQTLAAGVRVGGDIASQIGELSALSLRAHALGQGDKRIERIAYEDSIEPLMAKTTHRPVRWIAALMQPSQRRPRHDSNVRPAD